MKKLLTRDAARLLNLTSDRIRQMEREGVLRAEKTEGGVRLFERSDVEKLAKDRAKKKG